MRALFARRRAFCAALTSGCLRGFFLLEEFSFRYLFVDFAAFERMELVDERRMETEEEEVGSAQVLKSWFRLSPMKDL